MELGATVAEFDELARRYFDLIDFGPSDRVEWLTQVETVVADLYAAALRLPDTQPTDDSVPDADRSDLRRLSERIIDRVGANTDYYRTVFDPFDPKEEPVGSLLTDDLSSIYQDLRDGTQLLSSNAPLEDVIWTWRFGFQSHWSRHALGALQAIRAALSFPYGDRPS